MKGAWAWPITAMTVLVVAASHVELAAQAPVDGGQVEDAIARLHDGRPDLNGTWRSGVQYALNARSIGASICLGDCPELAEPAGPTPGRTPPERPSYRPEFQAEVARLDAEQVLEDPLLTCANPGVPRIGAPDKIMQNERELVFLYDDVNGSYWRIVPTDGRPHRQDIGPTFLGDAIGWWEGDTLVVETVNLNDKTWLTDDGSFHTTDLRVIERLTRHRDTITYEVTAFDPTVLAEPWAKRPVEMTLSDRELIESAPCIERDLDLMQDLSNHDNPR